MLDPWSLKNSVFKKNLARKIYVNKLLRITSAFHALNNEEKKSILSLGIPENKIFISPNAVDLPKYDIKNEKSPIFRIIYLGRIHKKKGLEILIDAFSKIIDKQIELHIAGWGDSDYLKKINHLIINKNLKNIHLVGPKFGNDKHQFFSEGSAFILPSYSEGLPMAVLEALSYGLPVLLTDECNLEKLSKKSFYFRITHSPKNIKNEIIKISKNKNLTKIRKDAINTIKNEYNWRKSARIVFENYKKLINESN